VTQTETFEAARGRLFGLAYRMLGSRAEAEDIIQEAYVRWHQAKPGSIDNAEAWLVTTTSRLAIDGLPVRLVMQTARDTATRVRDLWPTHEPLRALPKRMRDAITRHMRAVPL
jgi:DNA-directed RNA polymerase specialized sigma24 family protein